MIELRDPSGKVFAWRHEWDDSEGENPTCAGHEKKIPWKLNPLTGYFICGICSKPNPYNLVLCDFCEVIWLPETAAERIAADPHTKEMDHPDCAAARG